jgi:two-component system, OmpR family, osmolarity sensor histidine kinase EnvZ
MKLWPRTLLARTVIFIALLLVISQAVWVTLFGLYEREPQARQIAHRVSSMVKLTRAALLAAQPEKRLALLQELNREEAVRVYPLDPLYFAQPLPERPLLRMVAMEIRRELGEETEIVFSQDNVEGLWVSFAIGEDEYWVVMPKAQVERPFPWQWLGWGGLVLGLSIAGAWVIVARINRPLRAVAQAAESLGRGEYPSLLAEEGAEEIRSVSTAFNRMTDDLQRQEVDRALLLAGISHDLRTPLSRLRLGVEMSVHDEGEKASMIQDMEDMDRIIGQFLDFARQEQAASEAVDVNALVTALEEEYGRRGATVATELALLPPFSGYPAALRRALFNLVENALAHGGGDILIRTRSGKGRVVVSVLDRGMGIPEAELQAVKGPFRRLDESRSGARGSGLGLAIVERIARMHGGRLLLLNREGGGLEARLELPLP